MPKHLALIETHPIQYKAPLFRVLAADPQLNVQVLYAMLPDAEQQGAGFGVDFQWDVPLLEGYPYRVLENVAAEPSVTRFSGCDTPGLYALLKRERPGAVLVNGWVVKTCLQALWACRLLGIPCLVRGEANRLRPRAWWKRILHRILLKQYAGYLYIGEANRDFYAAHGCPEDRLFFAPYAVDNAYFAREAEKRKSQRAALRAQWGITEDACVFLFAGKLEPKKRPLDIVEALGLLRDTGERKAVLLVAGDGPLRDALVARARELKVELVMAGFLNQSQLPDAYAAADVLVLPSDAGETWGLVVNEAMASGRPAIVSRLVGCVPDLITHGETGFSYDCGDIPALAKAMHQYYQHPALSAQHGQAASRRCERYSFDAIRNGLVDALDGVKGS